MIFNIAFILKDANFAKDDLDKAVAYFTEKTPLTVTYNVIENPEVRVSHTLFKKSEYDNTFWMGTYKLKDQLRPLIPENEYHAVCFIYDRSKYIYHTVPNFTIASWSFWKPLYARTEYTEVATDMQVDKEWTWKLITHELMHAFVKRANRHGRQIRDEMDETLVKNKKVLYHLNHDPFAKDGNYARTLNNLGGNWDMVAYFPEKTKWKYFTANEVRGLQDILVSRLDKAREMAGIPFVITSGFRTPAQNKRVGGAPNSAHLRGLAADIACESNENRFKIVRAAIACGINRIGIAKTFIHLDVDDSLPNEVTWLYT